MKNRVHILEKWKCWTGLFFQEKSSKDRELKDGELFVLVVCRITCCNGCKLVSVNQRRELATPPLNRKLMLCISSNASMHCFLGRLPKVDLIILEGGGHVRPYVRPYVRTSTKSFFDFNEIWYIGRRPRSRSRSRSRALQSLNSFHFQNLSPPPFTIGAGK